MYEHFVLQFVWIDDDRFLGLDGAIALAVSHVVRHAQQMHGIDEAVAAIRYTVQTARLMVELAVRTHGVTIVVGTCGRHEYIECNQFLRIPFHACPVPDLIPLGAILLANAGQ